MPKLRVLILDGHGVPGLSLLPALRLLEKAVVTQANNLGRDALWLTDVFDWIVGTSVGGIMAVSLRDHTDVDSVQRVTIGLLRDEFKVPSMLSKFSVWRCKRRTGYRYRGIMLDSRIFLRFLMQTMPDNTAVVVHDQTLDVDVALDHKSLVNIRPAICGTMAEPGILPPGRQGKRIFTCIKGDPLSAFLALGFKMDDLFVLSIEAGIKGQLHPNVCSWQIPTIAGIAFDDTSDRSISNVLNVELDDKIWGGSSPDAIASWILQSKLSELNK